ncbi:MAG: hypothetical protein ABL921_14195 [Pirellula sp.]
MNDQATCKRSRPFVLLLLLSIAYLSFCVVSRVPVFSILKNYPPINQQGFISYALQQLWVNSHVFPWAQLLVVWLAARQGMLSWRTYLLPVLLIGAESLHSVYWSPRLIEQIDLLFAGSTVPEIWLRLPPKYILWRLASLICFYALLLFGFRCLSLCLRPVESETVSSPLGIRTILYLTTMIAIGVGLYVHCNRLNDGVAFPSNPQLTQFRIYDVSFSQMFSVILWLSIAWIWARGNTHCRLAWFWVLFFIVAKGYYSVLLLQMEVAKSSRPIPFLGDRFATLLISPIVQSAVAYLCVGAMAWCGYLWENRRQSNS